MASRVAGPVLGRGFGAGQGQPFQPVAQMLLGAACGALAVCGLQFVMVVLSEIDLKRSVDGVSE